MRSMRFLGFHSGHVAAISTGCGSAGWYVSSSSAKTIILSPAGTQKLSQGLFQDLMPFDQPAGTWTMELQDDQARSTVNES